MRMACHHFVGNAFGHIFKRKTTFFFGNASVKDNLQQKITKLITRGLVSAKKSRHSAGRCVGTVWVMESGGI